MLPLSANKQQEPMITYTLNYAHWVLDMLKSFVNLYLEILPEPKLSHCFLTIHSVKRQKII